MRKPSPEPKNVQLTATSKQTIDMSRIKRSVLEVMKLLREEEERFRKLPPASDRIS